MLVVTKHLFVSILIDYKFFYCTIYYSLYSPLKKFVLRRIKQSVDGIDSNRIKISFILHFIPITLRIRTT